MEDKDNKFNYTYKAYNEDEKKEALSIKEQYLDTNKELTPLEKLRILDNKVKRTPIIVSLALGIIGILIFGLGLTFCLEWDNLILGAILCIIGAIPCGVSYPIYSYIFNRNKEKYKDDIIALSNMIIEE